MKVCAMTRMLCVLALSCSVPAMCAAEIWTPIKFKSNYGDEIDVEQTVITVPENRARGGNATIKLPVIRIRSTSSKPGPPIVYLSGGPGASGIAVAKQDLFPILMRLRKVADVVVFDQRGTGGSSPGIGLPGTFDLPLGVGADDPATAARLREIATTGAVIVKQRGLDLSAYNTVESAEDIEPVRGALGAKRLAIWGHSYGSHLGLQYIRAHPDRVARAVLGGINDVDNRWRLPADSDALLNRVDAAVKAQPRLRERMPDFLGVVRRVAARLSAKPEMLTVEGRAVFFGKFELQAMLALRGGDLDFVRNLPLLFAQMDAGDFAQIGPALVQLKQGTIGSAMRYSMHIASGVSPERLNLIKRQAAGSISGDAINYPFNFDGFTKGWGVTDLGDGFRKKTPSKVPVLFMNGEFDGRTSVREAKETASRFLHGSFTEILGSSHTFYQGSAKVTDAMIGFLQSGARPPATLRTLPTEFASPDQPQQLAELQALLKAQGASAMVARMQEMAAQKSGPYFNPPTARALAGIVGRTLGNPAAAIMVLEAADQLYPNDYGIVRGLAEAYRLTGKIEQARQRLLQLLILNPVAAGVEQQLRALPQP